jgi:hypothetical protein
MYSPDAVIGQGRSFPVSRALARDTHVKSSWVLSFPFVFSGAFSERLEDAGYDPVDVGRETGCREHESEQDADQRVQDAQAGIPAQDEYRDSQDDQER